MQCIISDNGKGMQQEKNKNKKSSSTKLISNFIKRTTNTEVEITDLGQLKTGEKGIKVQFLIPFKIEEND